MISRNFTIFLAVILMAISTANSQNSLSIPPTLSGTEFDIDIRSGLHEFLPEKLTPTWGYNGNFLGPTLIFKKGDNVQFWINNLINEETTVHWHGLNVPPSADGGATLHSHIHPGETATPSFKVMDRAGTYWYHPHPHENTETHVVRGLAGMIIIQDEEEAALDLPRTYGLDDFPLIIQDKTFDSTIQIVETGLSHEMMVNGTLDALLNTPSQVVRFRVLNGSASRHYMLGWSDSTNLIQIASDGGLLESPLSIPRILLSPGERAEFIENFSGRMGDTLSLMSFATEMPEGTAGQGIVIAPGLPGANSPLNGAIFPILKLKIVGQTANPVLTLPPNQLSVLPEMHDTTGLEITRVLTINSPNNGAGGPFYFNEEFFDINVMNQIVPIHKTEIWLIRNQSLIGHPFHLHGGSYYILERNGNAPHDNELGLKDVWLVERGGSIKILVRFDDHSDNQIPYMYHCHMLGHEDGGLMGNVLVVDSSFVSTSEEKLLKPTFTLSPNPTKRFINVRMELNTPSDVNLEVFSITGQSVLTMTKKANSLFEEAIDLSASPKGIYFLKIIVNGYSQTQKLIISGN